MPLQSQYKKSNSAWIPLVMALMLAIGFLTGMKTSQKSGGKLISISKNKSTASYKVDEVLGYISQRYVDSIDVDKLAEAAIRMIVDSLDPHSSYLDAATVAEYQAKMDGQYVGLGIEFRILRDTVLVTDVLDESPAEKSGLARGDQIMIVNSDTLSGIGLPEYAVYDLLKGEMGSEVTMKVRRCTDALDEILIKRATVHTKSVPMAHALDDSTVYIVVESFNANTSKEFLDQLEPYHENNALKNLIIDLRGNPGGYLQEAVRMLNQFFTKKGKALVYTQGIHAKKTEYKTAGRPYLNVDELYILIDEQSASASEIVAGAIQDLDRGTIIGRRSFGKGLVQEQYPLSHGGHLKLTIAKYYTPSGRLIQKQVGNRADYRDEFTDRASSGEWLHESDIPRPDSIEFSTPAGRKLYGSRGIVPDIFIPLDSTLLKESALERYVLKEELAFDLMRQVRCAAPTYHEIIETLDEPFWMEYLRNKTSIENIGRLSSIPASELPAFMRDVKVLMKRYEGGRKLQYEAGLASDPFIVAAMSDLQSKHVSQKLTTQNRN